MATSEAILDSQTDVNQIDVNQIDVNQIDVNQDSVNQDDEFLYRPLSTMAIASILLGVLSALTFVAGKDSLQTCLMLCPIPVVGLFCGLKALAKIRQMPDQLSGRFPAIAGTVLSAIGLFGGLSYAGYVHATEVPSGYQRLSFINLRPDKVELVGKEVIPRDVKDLDGQTVFIKGFMRPGTHVSKGGTPVRNNVSRFLLVRDNNECCFGDISSVKYYDQMLVLLTDKLTTSYSSGLFRLAGKLRIVPASPREGRPEPTYLLEADYIQ